MAKTISPGDKPIPPTSENTTFTVPQSNPSRKNTHYGIEFPSYFVNPRWVQTADMSFTLAVENSNLTIDQRVNWSKRYLPELAALGKLIMEKKFKETIKSL